MNLEFISHDLSVMHQLNVVLLDYQFDFHKDSGWWVSIINDKDKYLNK
jgi:hypothetical protein